MNTSTIFKSIVLTVPYILMVSGIFIIINAIFYPSNPRIEDVSVNDSENSNANQGVISNDGISTRSPEVKTNDTVDPEVSGVSTNARLEKSNNTKADIMKTGVWKATDYEFGDISKGIYTVELGDTLWEISEAVYGDGSSWSKILSANSSSIGFLPNGSQALIIPGQVLVLT